MRMRHERADVHGFMHVMHVICDMKVTYANASYDIHDDYDHYDDCDEDSNK